MIAHLASGLRTGPDRDLTLAVIGVMIAAVAGVFDWLKRRRSLAAALAGLYAAWRVGKLVLGIGWSFGGVRFLESAPGFLADHLLIALAVLAGVFALTFVTVRWLIDWLDRRERRRREGEAPTQGEEGAPEGGAPARPGRLTRLLRR